jgi:hypothetical protein
MVHTRRQKETQVANNPLRDAGILRNVFTFLPGYWLFLGAVCREWEAIYAGMPDQYVLSTSFNYMPQRVTYGSRTTFYSAAVASLSTAMLAHSSGLEISENEQLHFIAGLYADKKTLAGLRELGMPLSETLIEAVAKSGRLNVLKHLLKQQQCPRPDNLSYHAALSGSISMLKWLRAKSWCTFGVATCAGAASGGHLAALKHLFSIGCDWDEMNIAWDAASSGSIEAVEWLRQEKGVVIDAGTLKAAAAAGQTALCAHLRSIGCPWSAALCDQAAMSALCGNFDTLRWLRDNGCPWNVRHICIHAASLGDTALLDYVIEQGEVLDAELLTFALNTAGEFSSLQVAQWLRQHGAEWPAVLGYDDATGQYNPWKADMIAWARAEGCSAPNDVDAASSDGSDNDSDSGSNNDSDSGSDIGSETGSEADDDA